MIKITNNDDLRQYIYSTARRRETKDHDIASKIARVIHVSLSTVQGWILISNPKTLTPRNAKLIEQAIERGDI